MENKIKQAVSEMLRMGEDPHEVSELLAKAYQRLKEARDYTPVDEEYIEYVQAIKDADFRP